MHKIAFATKHLSTGGMPRFVLNSIKHLDRAKFQPFLFEEAHYHIDEIRDQILAIPNLTHYLCPQKDRFLDLIFKHQIDLIHYHDWDIHARPVNTPAIETIHNACINNIDIGYADLYLLISDHQIPYFQGKNFRRINTFVDNFEFDPQKFLGREEEIKTAYGFGKNEKIVMYVGILTPGKNQEGLLNYWRENIATLVFVGPLAENFEDYWVPLMAKYQSEKIRFLGAQKDIPALLSIADVVINCSSFEGCCIANLEAAAMGKPLVVTDIASNIGVFQDEETALIRPLDISFVNAIEKLLVEDSSEIGARAKEMIEREYSVKQYNETMDEIYMSFLAPDGNQYHQKQNELMVTFNSDGVLLQVPEESPTHKYTFTVYRKTNEGFILSYETIVMSKSDVGIWALGDGTSWYTQYKYELFRDNILIQEEIFSLENKEVLIDFCSNALGDTIAWIPYVLKFHSKQKCKLTVKTPHEKWLRQLFPDISFCLEVPAKEFYFTYSLGVFNKEQHPINWRYVPLQKIASDLLGLDFEERNLDLTQLSGERSFNEKYICIAPRSTMKCKEWNYQFDRGREAWQTVVDWLLTKGYQIIWISKEKCFLEGVIDKSGDISLEDRITDLTYADFYIGLPAGLSWLAHACDIHVFMIAGFSYDWCEFQKNITRISRNDVCRGCFNEEFNFTREWDWCPKEKQFQCTSFINPDDVITSISNWLGDTISQEIVLAQKLETVESRSTKIHANLLYWIIRELNPRHAIELGAYQGFTTIHLAQAIKDSPRGEKLTTIDNFTFIAENDNINAEEGRRRLERNLVRANVRDIVEIIEDDTVSAINKIEPFEFAFIDAGHDYEIAEKDFENCWIKLAPQGIIALHDTASWPPLVRLIDELRLKYPIIEFFQDEGLTLFQKQNKGD